MIFIFWTLVFVILYCYVGYTIILFFITLFKGIFKRVRKDEQEIDNLPSITIVIPAYNEQEIVEAKVLNTNSTIYPKNKIHQIWVTDGSTDDTPKILKKYAEITILHNPDRQGKAMAINHAMEHVKTPIVVFSDANTMLSPNSLLELVNPFQDSKVGCVAGEKRINFQNQKGASSTGEGVYWKYESFIKQLETESGSTLSAAGELFAIRTELFQLLEPNTILDDFEISIQVALAGFRVIYAKNAVATEGGSLNFAEERKRKIRIAAGGFQMLFRRKQLLNPFIYPLLTFKYVSHKVLRWTIVPLAIVLLPIINFLIILNNSTPLYIALFICLLLFYGMALIGYLLKNNTVKYHTIFLPYYLVMMHISELQGFWKYINNKQDVKWDKARRET